MSVGLANAIGSHVPLPLGHYFAGVLARHFASMPSGNITRAVRANQWVVHQERLSSLELDACVQMTFQHITRSVYDLYHYLDDPGGFRRELIFDEATRQLIRRPEFDRRGLLIAGLHLSSFDLVWQWVVRRGLRPLVLTLPDTHSGYRLQDELRRKSGANLLPVSVASLRLALRYLRRGGIVLTAIDRPLEDATRFPMFFGRPAALPTHYAFLAARAAVPVMVMSVIMQADGKYHLHTSDLIKMDALPDRDMELLCNTEKVLAVAEDFIRLVPEQWTVTLPVWPDVMEMFE